MNYLNDERNVSSMNHTSYYGSAPIGQTLDSSFYTHLQQRSGVGSAPITSTPIIDRTGRRPSGAEISSSMSHHNLAGFNRNGTTGACRSEQLRRRIHEYHLSYVNREELATTPTREQIYDKLESLITEYLSLIPNSHKFSFKEMHSCFCDTASGRAFKPRAVINAFSAIEHYAVNLLNFPWRYEYRKINAYGGFFVHTIDRVLVNYRPLLELIGFEFNEPEQVYYLSEAPIDPDRLFQISLECLVAIVECKIMLEIYIESSTGGEKVSWQDIHCVRVDYVANIKNAVKLLADLKKTGKLIDLDAPDYSVKRFNTKLETISPSVTSVSHYQPPKQKAVLAEKDAQGSHLDVILPPPKGYLESDLDGLDYIDSEEKARESMPPPPTTSAPRSRVVVVRRTPMNEKSVTRPRTLIEQRDELQHRRHKSSTSLESELVSPPKIGGATRISPSDLESALHAELQQFEAKGKRTNTSGTSNSKESTDRFRFKETLNELKLNNDRLQRFIDVRSEARAAKDPQQLVKSSARSSGTGRTVAVVGSGPTANGWSCKSCTYVNKVCAKICTMCSRSRSSGAEAKPLMSGGRECSRCTLVNSRDESVCTACGTSLSESPTYI